MHTDTEVYTRTQWKIPFPPSPTPSAGGWGEIWTNVLWVKDTGKEENAKKIDRGEIIRKF